MPIAVAQPPPAGTWEITGPVEVTQDIRVPGDIHIRDGGNLTIIGADVTVAGTLPLDARVDIDAGGRLELRGVEGRPARLGPIEDLDSLEESLSAGQGFLLFSEPGSSIVGRDCEIGPFRYSQTGYRNLPTQPVAPELVYNQAGKFQGDVRLDSCTIVNADIVRFMGPTDVQRSRFAGVGNIARQVTFEGTGLVKDTQFELTDFRLEASFQGVALNNSMTAPTNQGGLIALSGATKEVLGLQIHNGLACVEARGDLVLRGLVVSDCSRFLVAAAGTVVVKGSSFVGSHGAGAVGAFELLQDATLVLQDVRASDVMNHGFFVDSLSRSTIILRNATVPTDVSPSDADYAIFTESRLEVLVRKGQAVLEGQEVTVTGPGDTRTCRTASDGHCTVWLPYLLSSPAGRESLAANWTVSAGGLSQAYAVLAIDGTLEIRLAAEETRPASGLPFVLALAGLAIAGRARR